MKLTGAAILVSRGTNVLQAAAAAYRYRSASEGITMAEVDRRRGMSAAEFDAIAADDQYLIDGLYEALIDRNERITHEVYERPERFKELTAGQRMLVQLGT